MKATPANNPPPSLLHFVAAIFAPLLDYAILPGFAYRLGPGLNYGLGGIVTALFALLLAAVPFVFSPSRQWWWILLRSLSLLICALWFLRTISSFFVCQRMLH
jgi:hypothetical protein